MTALSKTEVTEKSEKWTRLFFSATKNLGDSNAEDAEQPPNLKSAGHEYLYGKEEDIE